MKLACILIVALSLTGCATKHVKPVAVQPPEILEYKYDDCSYIDYFERTECLKTMNLVI